MRSQTKKLLVATRKVGNIIQPASTKLLLKMKIVTLPSGDKLPVNGFGTWKAEPGECARALRAALDAGYRHIDCAAVYMNEKELGPVFAEYFRGPEPKIKREDVFITSKVRASTVPLCCSH